MIIHYLIAFAFAFFRLFGITSQSFQAAAHLYVGLLVGLYWESRKREYLYLAAGLSLIEIAAALYFHFR